MSKKNILVFTNLLSQYLEANVSLIKSLHKISLIQNLAKDVVMAASNIEEKLEKGTTLSLALDECCYIKFPKVYIAFVSSAEKTGNIKGTFNFLLERESIIYKRKTDLISLSIYPIAVVILSFLGSLLLVKYGALLVPNITGKFDDLLFKKNAIYGCIKANFFLILICFGGIYFFKKMFSSSPELDLFRAINFLTTGGIDLHLALVTSMSIVEGNNCNEKKLVSVIEDLEKGQSISKSFEKFGKKYSYYFCIAEDCNDFSSTIKNIVKAGEEKENRNSKRVMEFMEPSIMACVAIYIIILLKTVVMPVLFDYGI